MDDRCPDGYMSPLFLSSTKLAGGNRWAAPHRTWHRAVKAINKRTPENSALFQRKFLQVINGNSCTSLKELYKLPPPSRHKARSLSTITRFPGGWRSLTSQEKGTRSHHLGLRASSRRRNKVTAENQQGCKSDLGMCPEKPYSHSHRAQS